MWEVGAFLGLPVGAFLEVEHLVESRVTLLAVCVVSHPVVAVDAVALCILEINLGDGNLAVTTLAALCLDGEVATGYRLVELDGLPAVARLELAKPVVSEFRSMR